MSEPSVAQHEESSSLSAGYATLPARFYAHVNPVPVSAPTLVRWNSTLAEQLGLEDLDDPERLADFFSGNKLLPGSNSIATAYAGHQFGNFVPQLGDGRAVLLGERAMSDGSRWDIQLKGSGRTPFSRGGDGRAAIGPVLREYIVSEAMHALAVPSTRALAAVSSGESVYRDAALPGAVFTRVAASHIRVGTFEYFASRGDIEGTRALADYVIARHYPDIMLADAPYLELLRAVVARQAALVAQWMAIGFIHGVMNTDNMTVSGHTIDFGPCAYLDAYHADAVFSSIDQRGRYAYGNQPSAAQWNLARFAETLLPLMAIDQNAAIATATQAVNAFVPTFEAEHQSRMLLKLGIVVAEPGDAVLLGSLLAAMQDQHADFSITFRALSDVGTADTAVAQRALALLRSQFENPAALDAWLVQWRQRLTRDSRSMQQIAEDMQSVNPVYIPRNHRIEEAIVAAVESGNYMPFHRLVDVLREPYRAQAGCENLMKPPLVHERVLRTYCGT